MNKKRLLLRAVLAATSGEKSHGARLLEEVLETDPSSTQWIPEWAHRNEAEVILYALALETTSPLGGELAKHLEPLIAETIKRAKYMAELIRLMDRVLTGAGIEYTVFKTVNRLGRVDVDVDTIIHPSDYWHALRLLHRVGLRPVDDIRKTYATGLMLPGNPIVLDLHTDLTVLGIPYLDREILLHGAERVAATLPGEQVVETRIAIPLADTVARIGHALIKEAELKLDDITETLPVLTTNGDQVQRILRSQGIQEAHRYYLEAVRRALETAETPLRLDRATSIELLLKRLARRRQPVMLLRALGNLRYKRNAAHIGKLFIVNKLTG